MAYHAKKRLGQHFLTSPDIIQRIIDLIDPSKDKTIIEIGPGQGALTKPLAASGADLVAIEFDNDLIKRLKKLLKPYPNTRLLNIDFLLFEPELGRFPNFTLVGNLPYNITSPVLDWCVKYRSQVDRAVFMVQRELARRIAASPGSKDWSPLSIFTQLWFDVKMCFDVPPEAFQPPPEVISSVIELTARGEAAIENIDSFDRVVRQSFTHRRKTLVNNLVPDIIPDTQRATDILDEIGLDHGIRAEQLTIDDFLKLTQTLISRNILSV